MQFSPQRENPTIRAALNVHDKRGCTPQDVAARHGNHHMASILQAASNRLG